MRPIHIICGGCIKQVFRTFDVGSEANPLLGHI